MKTVIVRYKTTDAHGEKNVANIHAVFDELRKTAPPGIRYTTYRHADGVSFFHVATIDGESPLAALAPFQAFQKELRANCVEPPIAMDLQVVDSYAPEAK